MSYKNSIKLLSNNFGLVWKQLLYTLIISLIIFPISFGTATPIINILKEEGVIAEFGAIFENIYTAPKDIITSISTAMLHLGNVLTSNFSSLWFSIIATFLILTFAYNILKEMSVFNVSNVMYMQMTSFLSVGYTRNLISNLVQSIRFGFTKTILKIPFSVVKTLILFVYLKLVKSWWTILIGLFIVISFIIILNALEIALFSGFAGKLFDSNGNISSFKAFFKGVATISKHFPKIFLNAIIVVLTIILINGFLGLFTVGAALLITIPASTIFICIFELTSYFGCKGDRYYLTNTIIINPIIDNNQNK